MGGKKKTKWRKLPLEEFTKEISPKQEEQNPIQGCRTDAAREENDFIPTYNGPPEVTQNYAEPYEYIDGIWYPTSCVVYNPGLFSNYMMPADTGYYYCTMPEAGQMQDYMPVPYQEYTSALPKDTVYLLLPTQTLRPTQPVQNVAPDWQSRRRRRRYEGYAEYAVIPPEKSSKADIKDHSRLSGAHTRRSTHYNNFRRMSSLSETSSSDGFASEPNQIPRKPSEMKKNPTNSNNEKGPSYVSKEMSLPNSQNGNASKKSIEICGIHKTKKEHQTRNEETNAASIHDELHQAPYMCNVINFDQADVPVALRIATKNTNTDTVKEHFDAMDQDPYMSNAINFDQADVPVGIAAKNTNTGTVKEHFDAMDQDPYMSNVINFDQADVPVGIATKNTNTGTVKEHFDAMDQDPYMSNVINFDQADVPVALRIATKNTNTGTVKEHFDAIDDETLISIEVSEGGESLNNYNNEREISTKSSSLKPKYDLMQDIAEKKEARVEEIRKTDSLPDIVSSLTKTTNRKLLEADISCEVSLCDNADLNKEKSPKSSPQTSNTQHFEALHNEMEMELKQLQSLKASQANQAIYKLAYDENDQSSNSRSPSPILSPEDHIPSSFPRNEIIVHEADSDDDAGSEDVELIPHRYESESYLNQQQNKNIYVNKLSLAVELLRTQENLPYDGDFKRIVGENNVERSVHYNGNGTVNLGFKRDSCSPEESSLTKGSENSRDYNTKSNTGITSQSQLNPSPDNSNDSAIYSDTDITNFEDESSESVKDGVPQANETRDNTDEIRRLRIRARRQFSPFPFNPCFCCIIM